MLYVLRSRERVLLCMKLDVHYDPVSCILSRLTSARSIRAWLADLSLHIIKCATVVSMSIKHQSQCYVVSSKRHRIIASFFGNLHPACVQPLEHCTPPSEQRVSKDRGHKWVTRLPGEAESMKVLSRCRDHAQYLRRLFADKKGKHKTPKKIRDDLELWSLDAR